MPGDPYKVIIGLGGGRWRRKIVKLCNWEPKLLIAKFAKNCREGREENREATSLNAKIPEKDLGG
jgi:hypothetical protein